MDSKYANVTTLNHVPVIKFLLSQLRDVDSDSKRFRQYSDRIMRLLLEEAIS